jgi:hypothetical protein
MRKKDKPTNLWNCGERLLRVEGHHIDTDISWRRKITKILAERLPVDRLILIAQYVLVVLVV